VTSISKVERAPSSDDHFGVDVARGFRTLFEAGLFESKIRIRYACVHLGGFTKEISSSH
jgi:hypothetical protein